MYPQKPVFVNNDQIYYFKTDSDPAWRPLVGEPIYITADFRLMLGLNDRMHPEPKQFLIGYLVKDCRDDMAGYMIRVVDARTINRWMGWFRLSVAGQVSLRIIRHNVRNIGLTENVWNKINGLINKTYVHNISNNIDFYLFELNDRFYYFDHQPKGLELYYQIYYPILKIWFDDIPSPSVKTPEGFDLLL